MKAVSTQYLPSYTVGTQAYDTNPSKTFSSSLLSTVSLEQILFTIGLYTKNACVYKVNGR